MIGNDSEKSFNLIYIDEKDYPDKKSKSVYFVMYDSESLPIGDLLHLMWSTKATDLVLKFDQEFFCFHGIKIRSTHRFYTSHDPNNLIFDETCLAVDYVFESCTCGEVN